MNKVFNFMRESSTARFFIPLGIILIVFGIVMFSINKKNQNYIKIESIVSNVKLIEDEHIDVDGNRTDATYDVSVKYTVDGKEYVSSLYNVSKYNIGDKINIYYNPEDPSKITQTKSLLFPLAFIITGIASLVGGIISIINFVKKQRKMKIQEKSWENGK